MKFDISGLNQSLANSAAALADKKSSSSNKLKLSKDRMRSFWIII